MSVLSSLPQPLLSHQHVAAVDVLQQQEKTSLELAGIGPPQYGRRRNFVPRNAADFGDGGAFPEIHVAQYPLDMGKSTAQGSKTLALSTNANGQVTHDALVKQGGNKDRIVHTGRSNMHGPRHEMHSFNHSCRPWIPCPKAGTDERECTCTA